MLGEDTPLAKAVRLANPTMSSIRLPAEWEFVDTALRRLQALVTLSETMGNKPMLLVYSPHVGTGGGDFDRRLDLTEEMPVAGAAYVCTVNLKHAMIKTDAFGTLMDAKQRRAELGPDKTAILFDPRHRRAAVTCPTLATGVELAFELKATAGATWDPAQIAERLENYYLQHVCPGPLHKRLFDTDGLRRGALAQVRQGLALFLRYTEGLGTGSLFSVATERNGVIIRRRHLNGLKKISAVHTEGARAGKDAAHEEKRFHRTVQRAENLQTAERLMAVVVHCLHCGSDVGEHGPASTTPNLFVTHVHPASIEP